MKPSSVYYIPAVRQAEQFHILSSRIVLDHRAFQLLRIFYVNEVVGVKPCSVASERTVDYVNAITEMLVHKGCSSVVCDTSNRHLDLRENAVVHARRLEKQFIERELPKPSVMMLDGMKGEHEVVNRLEKTRKEAYLAGELPNFEGLVVVSSLSVHNLAGLAGAVANAGMGFASKRGKIRQNTTSIPHVNVDKCYTCRRCLHNCPVEAIYMAEKHVAIDPDKCINCGQCVEMAQFGGITYEWNASAEHFQEVVSVHAMSVLEMLERRTVFVSLLNSLCGDGGSVGTLISRDPVAIDRAAVDILRERGAVDEEHLEKVESLVAAAEELGSGTGEYELETIAY